MKLTNRANAPAINEPRFPSILLPKCELINEIPCYYIDVVEPLSRFDIIFNHGTLQQSQKASVSSALNLCLSGTKELNQKEILAKLDYYGVFTDFSSESNHSTLSIYSTPEHITESTSFILKCIINCVFPDQELQLYKQSKISQLKQKEDKTSYLATRELNKAFFNEEHIKNPANENDYTNLSSNILRKELTNICFARKDIYLVSNTNDLSLLSTIVKDHVPQGTIVNNKKNSYSRQTHIAHIHHPKAVQTSFRMRFPTISKSHEDYAALVMVNVMLGGYFGSLLMKNIREEKGLTYGINSQLISDKDKGSIFIGSDIKKESAPLVLKEIVKEINALKAGDISEDFFTKSRNYLRGVTAKKNDEVFNSLEIIKSLNNKGISPNFQFDLYKKIDALSLENCINVANKHLIMDQNVVVTCGPEQYETTDFV